MRSCAAACRNSSPPRSIPTSTSGRRPASSPRTRCSRRWAIWACSASPSRRVWRPGPRLFLRHGHGRGARQHRLRQRADGDRRADRHGDAGARPLRLRRGQARVPGAVDRRRLSSRASASPKSAPAPTSPRSRPRRARTAATTSSTAARCGPRTARRPTGCACSPTPREGPPHKNKSLICLPMKTKGVEIARKLDKLGMRSSDTAQIFFDDVRVPQRYPDRRGGQGLHLSDDAVPGGAAVGAPPLA